jgi:outer membrane protein OmpA-like peptidoglycan-associated protein
LARFYKDSSYIKVSLLNINSPQSDFSPTLYKNGLVFTSARKGNTNKVFGWNNTSFLDLYYVEDTAKIKPASGELLQILNSNSSEYASKVHSDETRQTSNDSPVLGYLSDNNSTINNNADTLGIKRFDDAINSKFHEGPAAFYRSGDTMLFTRNSYNGGGTEKSKEGIVKLQIFTATKANGNWGNVQEFSFNNKDYSVGHPALSSDNKTLYFISDMPGSIGGTDIYSSTWDGSKWNTPVNLGKKVNTEGDEMFPYISSDGRLYFSSNGHAGLGGLDIFKVDSSFSTVTNMGFPINTMKDDFGILFTNERNGYFSSNRKRGLADDDIYSFYIAPPIKLKVLVLNENTKEPLRDAKVVVFDTVTYYTDSLGTIEHKVDNPNVSHTVLASKNRFKDNSKTITSGELKADADRTFESTIILALKPDILFQATVRDKHTNDILDSAKVMILNQCSNTVETSYTDKNGSFTCALDTACSYVFKVVKEDFFPHCLIINKKTLQRNVLNGKPAKPIYLVKIELNATLEIEHLYYGVNQANISHEASLVLDHLKHLLEEYEDIKVELGSHTDSRSSAAYNNRLSQKRADSAMIYITKHGISKSRIKAKGYGERKLRNKCKDGVECTEEEHQLNRRTEIKVTGFVKPQKKYPKGKSAIHHHDTPLTPADDFSDCEDIKIVPR